MQVIQNLWDQMRTELQSDELPQLAGACRSLLDGGLGPLTEKQVEDLESVERSVEKLSRRIEGEPIDWNDYSEAAHALRGPLNSTIGFSRLMLKGVDGPITEGQNEALETIYNSSRRLLALFNLLLDAMLLLENSCSFTIESVPVDEVLEELITVGRVLAENRGFVFETDIDGPVAKATLQSDSRRLKQALSALLAVSAKYMDHGVLRLQARLCENILLVQLRNQACQLPGPLLDSIPRLLSDGAESFPYDARLRLGLAWRILTQMKGTLEAKQTGEACSFAVTLPAN